MKDFLMKEIGARQSLADPSMFYWSQYRQKSFFSREKCESWEDLEKCDLPPEVQESVKQGEVYGCCTVHVGDLAIFGYDKFCSGSRIGFLNGLEQKRLRKMTANI